METPICQICRRTGHVDFVLITNQKCPWIISTGDLLIFNLEVVIQSPLRYIKYECPFFFFALFSFFFFWNGTPVPYDYQTRINVLWKSTDLSLVRFSYEILRKPPTLCKRNMGTSRKCRPKTDREPLAQTQTLPVSNKESSLWRSRQHNSTSQLRSSPKETAPYNVMVVLCLWENPLSARDSIITQHLPCSLWRRPQNIPTPYLTIVTTPELF